MPSKKLVHTATIGIGSPACFYLEDFGRTVLDAFGDVPFLVGTAAIGKTWRDVDVRLMLSDDDFDALLPGVHGNRCGESPKWVALCRAFSELGRRMTGLPVDFQIQRRKEANATYQGCARWPIGVLPTRKGASDADPEA